MNPKRESWSKWHFHDLLADWNWEGDEGKLREVVVYSSCEEVELVLNGKSLSRKSTDRSSQFTATWEVPYEAGTLRAIGYTGGKQANMAELRSSAAPSEIRLSADRTALRPEGRDLAYIVVELTDAQGVRHPKADNLIHFETDGPGTIVGVGNANPVSTESYQQPHRKAWRGRCLVIVKAAKSSGTLTLRARSDGLEPARIHLAVEPPH